MKVGPGDELYLTYANNLLCQEARVLAHEIEGVWHTTGDPLRFLLRERGIRLEQPGDRQAACRISPRPGIIEVRRVGRIFREPRCSAAVAAIKARWRERG